MEAAVILGRNPVLEYINAPGDKNGYHLYISRSAHGKIIETIENAARARRIPVEKKEKEFFASVGNARHQGVMLTVTREITEDSPASPEQILTHIAEKKGLIVVLDNITDPHNTGAIIRTAEALGAGAVVWTKNNSAGLNPTTIKSAAGATAHIPTLAVPNLARFIDNAKKKGFWVMGTSGNGKNDPGEVRDVKPALVIIGSEGSGMRRLTEEKCDYLIGIPLQGTVSSLNASVAAGIIIYELTREIYDKSKVV